MTTGALEESNDPTFAPSATVQEKVSPLASASK